MLSAAGVLWREYRLEAIVGMVSLTVGLAVHLLSSLRFPNDDQFITFRYIDHIASGEGFVYNIGEHVLGTTTPLFTFLGAILKLMLPYIATPELMAYANIALLALGAILFYRLFLAVMPQIYAFVGSFVFVFDLAKAVPEGMESPLFITCILAFLLALAHERYRWSAAMLALACLTRPDAGLVAVLAFAFWWYKKGYREALIDTAVTIAVALPWLLFAFWYFGSIIPQSLVAKAHGHDIYIIPAIQAFKVQLAALSRIYWGDIFDPDNLALQALFNLIPFLALAGIGAWQFVRRGFWILPMIPALYFISFSVSDPVLFPWYSTQMEPLWIAISWMGAVWAMMRVSRTWFIYAVITALLIGPVVLWAQFLISTDAGSKEGLFTIGEYLRAHAKPGETIALSNIGIVGYITDAPIIDTIGLTYPQSSAFYPWSDSCRDMSNLYQMPPALIQATQPDWLVTGATELTSCFKESAWFKGHYQEAWEMMGNAVWHKIMR